MVLGSIFLYHFFIRRISSRCILGVIGLEAIRSNPRK